MNKQLKIMAWNANGLIKHKQILELVLKEKNIDICLISETHFTQESQIEFSGYTVYHTTHPANSARGGSAIVIKNSIVHYEEEKLSSFEFQATTVTVKTAETYVSITSLYSPPVRTIASCQYKSLIQKHKHKFIMGGDFNAKHSYWGSRTTSTKGRELFKAARMTGCDFISTGKPTYWPTDQSKIPDLIDFFVTHKISKNYLKIEEGADLDSDHSPIILTFFDHIVYKEDSPELTNKLTDWNIFQQYINAQLLPATLNTIEEIENSVISFTETIQKAAWFSTPVLKKKQVGLNYPNYIKNLLSEKRRLRRTWQETRAPEDKTNFNRAAQKLKRKLKEFKDQTYQNYITSLGTDKNSDYSLWKCTKKLNRPIVQSCPIKSAEGIWLRTSIEKAATFADHLENTFKPNEDFTNPTLEKINNPFPDEPIILIDLTEIKDVIKNLPNKKAPGFDLITAEILKQLPFNALIELTTILNYCLICNYVPSYWKVAEVIMILKPDKPSYQASSYRPISLLPVLSKVFEKVLLSRINIIIERQKIIPNHQFGFRSNHSTIDQVHRITNEIETSLENKQICSAVFLDVAQAFDKVWHEGLLFKLKSNLPRNYYLILKSYLSQRFFRVKCENEFSTLKEIRAGVPQGSILGPLLYLVFTCDLPQQDNVTTATFADDTAILATGKTAQEAAIKLQIAVDEIAKWTKKWKIKVNNAKSTHVNFTNRNITPIPIYFDQSTIPIANSAKYLGMTLDVKLRWNEHVKKKKSCLEIKYNSLKWLLGRHSSLSVQNKLLIYKQVLKPVWTYGIQLWGCACQQSINVIQRFQNKVLRNIVNAPWYIRDKDLHRDLKMETVHNVITSTANAHHMRLIGHVNVETKILLNTDDHPRRLCRQKPSDLVTIVN